MFRKGEGEHGRHFVGRPKEERASLRSFLILWLLFFFIHNSKYPPFPPPHAGESIFLPPFSFRHNVSPKNIVLSEPRAHPPTPSKTPGPGTCPVARHKKERLLASRAIRLAKHLCVAVSPSGLQRALFPQNATAARTLAFCERPLPSHFHNILRTHETMHRPRQTTRVAIAYPPFCQQRPLDGVTARPLHHPYMPKTPPRGTGSADAVS